MRALLLVMTLATSLFSTDCEKHLGLGVPSTEDLILCRDAFAIGYDYAEKSPAWAVAYVTRRSLKGHNQRDNRFYEDVEVPKQYRAWLSSYRGSGFDRGHLISNSVADYSKTSQHQSFLLSNIAPQHSGLNRYGWYAIEKRMREAIKRSGEGYIVTGIVYTYENDEMVRLKNGLKVPTHWYKALYLPKSKKVYGYLMPNAPVKKSEVSRYSVSIDTIESIARVDLFSSLPDALETRIEKRKERL